MSRRIDQRRASRRCYHAPQPLPILPERHEILPEHAHPHHHQPCSSHDALHLQHDFGVQPRRLRWSELFTLAPATSRLRQRFCSPPIKRCSPPSTPDRSTRFRLAHKSGSTRPVSVSSRDRRGPCRSASRLPCSLLPISRGSPSTRDLWAWLRRPDEDRLRATRVSVAVDVRERRG